MMLATLLQAYRAESGTSLRQLARQIGISHSSLFRFERGQDIESPQLAKIYHWVMLGIPNARPAKDA